MSLNLTEAAFCVGFLSLPWNPRKLRPRWVYTPAAAASSEQQRVISCRERRSGRTQLQPSRRQQSIISSLSPGIAPPGSDAISHTDQPPSAPARAPQPGRVLPAHGGQDSREKTQSCSRSGQRCGNDQRARLERRADERDALSSSSSRGAGSGQGTAVSPLSRCPTARLRQTPLLHSPRTGGHPNDAVLTHSCRTTLQTASFCTVCLQKGTE